MKEHIQTATSIDYRGYWLSSNCTIVLDHPNNGDYDWGLKIILKDQKKIETVDLYRIDQSSAILRRSDFFSNGGHIHIYSNDKISIDGHVFVRKS